MTNPRNLPKPPPWLGGSLFIAGFLVTSVAFAVVSSKPLPLPTAADEVIADYYRTEQGALWLAGVSYLISVSGLVIFFRGIRTKIKSRWVTVAFLVAAASLTLSALVAWVTVALAPQLPAALIATLVRVLFHLGGVVHVVALGGFVGAVLQASPPLRTRRALHLLGLVAAVVACASLLSVVLEPAAPLLPIGRVLCMIWILSLGVAWKRVVVNLAGPAVAS